MHEHSLKIGQSTTTGETKEKSAITCLRSIACLRSVIRSSAWTATKVQGRTQVRPKLASILIVGNHENGTRGQRCADSKEKRTHMFDQAQMTPSRWKWYCRIEYRHSASCELRRNFGSHVDTTRTPRKSAPAHITKLHKTQSPSEYWSGAKSLHS